MSNKSKCAEAANAKRTPEERKALSKKMVEQKKYLSSLPKAEYSGTLQIGDMVLNCCVLGDGRRVISEQAIQDTFGATSSKQRKTKEFLREQTGDPIPLFLASKLINPLINKVFTEGIPAPIKFNQNSREQTGYSAEILPKVCEVWLQARDEGVLQSQQLPKAKKAEILMRGLARVGIVALIDEATGYQKDRERDALAKILEAYVAKELQPWVKTFDPDYYEQIYRLRGLPYPPNHKNCNPQYFGNLTNNIVYERLAPGIKDALKSEAKKIQKSHRLHQHLTANYGRQELIKHLGTVIGLMKISKNWDEFIGFLDRVKPKFNQIALPLNK